MPNNRRSVATTRANGKTSNGRRSIGRRHLKLAGGALETTNATFDLYNNVFGEGSPLEKLTSKKRKPSPSGPDALKSASGTAAATGDSEDIPHDNGGRSRMESALQACGFRLGPWNEPTPPALGHGRGDSSYLPDGGMMEAVVNAIKTAYAPMLVNVVTWEADLHPETINCEGQMGRGTANNFVSGLSYKFIVFSGHGLIKWQGGGVGCAGNIRLRDDHISFGDPRYCAP